MSILNRTTICICGGGSLGTVIAGVAASKGYNVNILTGHPDAWSHEIVVNDPSGLMYRGYIDIISSDAGEIIPQSDIILCCLPGSVIYDQLLKIKPYLSKDAIVGSVFSCTGFFITAIKVLGEDARLFGFQRVPFIARVEKYGHTANLRDYRKMLNMAFWNVAEECRPRYVKDLSEILCAPITILKHALQVTLTNSNPILHPSRLYSLFKDFEPSSPYSEVPRFYEDWTDDSSQVLIACDEEFQTMLNTLGLSSKYTPPLLDYYESYDAGSLTRKITSIKSLKGLKVPMVKCENGYCPDWDNRYFTEDIPYGMLLVKLVCQHMNIETPNIDRIIEWYQSKVGKKYLVEGKIIENEDVAEIACLDTRVLQILLDSI